MLGVGNGGFSLRRIQYCIKLLERWKRLPYLTPDYLWKVHSDKRTHADSEKYIFATCFM